MKATTDTKALAAALKIVGAAAGARGLPILSGVRMEMTKGRLTLTCTSLELEITTAIDAKGRQGVVVAPWALLNNMVSKLAPGDVTLEHNDGRLAIDAGSVSADFATMAVEQWPVPMKIEGVPSKLTADDLEHIGRILPFAASDLTRPKLTGVHLNGSEAACTDSYRLGVATLNETFDPPATLPASTVRAVLASQPDDGVTITLGPSAAIIDSGTTQWRTALLPGDYPNYRTLIERAVVSTELTFNRDELGAAVNVCGVSRTGADHVLKITPGDAEATIDTRSELGAVTDVLFCSGDATDSFKVNGAYLLEVLATCDDDDVHIRLTDEAKVLVFDSPGLEVLLIPLKPDA